MVAVDSQLRNKLVSKRFRQDDLGDGAAADDDDELVPGLHDIYISKGPGGEGETEEGCN